MGEPVAFLVHQARVGVHVNLEHHADADAEEDADADAHVDADAVDGAEADVNAVAETNLDSISLSKLCNDTLSCHRVLVVAVVDLVRIFFSSARIKPVVVLVVEACQLVPIATDDNVRLSR